MWIYVKKLHLLLWRTPKDRRSGWKPIPSVARVTGTKSRDYKARKDDCLEDSTQLICSFTFGSVRTRSKSSRIMLIRRIISFSRILFLLVLPVDIGFTTDCICAYTALDDLQQEIIRENPSARQAQTNHNWIKKSVKEQIRRISVIRDWFWTWRASQRRVSTSRGYCLPDSSPLFS